MPSTNQSAFAVTAFQSETSPLEINPPSIAAPLSVDPLVLLSASGSSLPTPDGLAQSNFSFSDLTAGYFTVDRTGQVGIDYLFDGGGYEGELAIFSLSGLDEFTTDLSTLTTEIVRRALSDTVLGHVVIRDAIEGARFVGELGEGNANVGDYRGVQTFTMTAGDRFGVMLTPNGTIAALQTNPNLEGVDRPLFSLVGLNPEFGFQVGQIADVDGNGSTFVMEDLRVDGESDRDYNDIIFQVRGAIGSAVSLADVIPFDKDWRELALGQALLDYAAAYDNPRLPQPIRYEFPTANQPLIGIIDTGFSGNNPDFDYSRITLGRDQVDNDADPLLAAGTGNEHGTHILGIIGATQDNGIGIDGINDQAPLWVGRAIGSGKWAESLTEFVDRARQDGQPNAVVNLSLDLTQKNPDGSTSTRYEFTPEERKAIEYARQNGVILVVAAGNDGGVMSALGQASQEFDNIITVGAEADLKRADYSSYGYGLDILAPGGTVENPILSTVGNGVGTLAGTSVATAQVTGAISQVWAANPDLSYRQVIDLVKLTATDLGAPGWDEESGAGLLNTAVAVSMARLTPAQPYSPQPWFTPEIWSGEGAVIPGERPTPGNGVYSGTSIPVPVDRGQLVSTKVSNGVTINYYTNGQLLTQPSGFQAWYKQGSGSPTLSQFLPFGPLVRPGAARPPQPDNGSQPDSAGKQGNTPRPDSVYFADVDGDGKDDAMVVNNGGTTVRLSNGSQFLPNQDWTTNPYFGAKRTYFTDVDGDGKADAIVVNDNGVFVRRANSAGTAFLPPERWTNRDYFGDGGTFFADVDGDGRADAIAVNNNQIAVRLSTGNKFSDQHRFWTDVPYYGDKGTYFADVNGDGRADAIVVNSNAVPADIQGVTVRLSMPNGGFGQPQRWIDVPYYGDKGTYFADVNGDGRADAIVVNSGAVPADIQGVTVRLSMSSGGFGQPQHQINTPYLGDKGNYFADVTGDGKTDAIVSNEAGVVGVTVRKSEATGFSSNQFWTNGGAYYGTGGHGTIVKGTDDRQYLIEGMQRRWIPNPQTKTALGLDGIPIQTISDADLNGIPIGAELPSVSLVPPLQSNPTPSNPLRGFQDPLKGAGYISQRPGGERSHTGNSQYAIDFGVGLGTPVYAMRPGKVIFIEQRYPDTGGGSENRDRANMVVIEHDNGYYSRYLHLKQGFNSNVALQVGQIVEAGQLIGLSGNSGYSDGPHLHVEVDKGYTWISQAFEVEGRFNF